MPEKNTTKVVYLRTAVALGALILVAVLLVSTIVMAITSIGLKSTVNSQKTELKEIKTILKEASPLADYEFAYMPYQDAFLNLYVDAPGKFIEREKTVFLTFDDGPSARTPEVLDILKENGITATFFVVGNEDEESRALMKRIVDEGHTIGVHTYTHDYDEIYASVDAYLSDFEKINTLIYEATGERANIFRFPGGSVNLYNATNNVEISAEMLRRGFVYYDWNVTSADAAQGATAESVLNYATSSTDDRIIIHMHDSEAKTYTVAALPDIIKHYKDQGYKFASLENTDKPIALNAK